MSHISAFPAAWLNRFADLPIFPGRSIIAEHDGDTSLLRHLIDRILEGNPVGVLRVLPNGCLYRQIVNLLDINPAHIDWPDPAGALLTAWRCGR